ncbi:flavodoxin family protein [Reyranella sp. CPCC 100927]|uniref:flavodoxin family protein n=1 Tax=Reyranella sp. CPCC 100927 TaxID=2599616 RepID=UPI0011B4EA3A|nr:flavodoxin family protein [Reyranella sp. CPCC 100927]TWT13079.1 flavodoxin family protein [Reyranella sp. CPCC 100927]
MKALVLCSSPRQQGNSARLARAVATGLAASGHDTETVYLADAVTGFIRDCRTCRRADGTCSIDDGHASLFLDRFLDADGVVVATPVYWYSMSAQLKAFFDRMSCYLFAAYPGADSVMRRMKGKRIGLVLSSEEAYPTLSAGVIQPIQEYVRYTHGTFVGVVHGQGNARGEVSRDPRNPIAQAEQFGRDFFALRYTDYQIDTPRAPRVWESPNA